MAKLKLVMKLEIGKWYTVQIVRQHLDGAKLEEEDCQYNGFRNGRHEFVGSSPYGDESQIICVAPSRVAMRVREAK